MAHVSSSTRIEVDRLLERALAGWQSIPDVEREIDTWDLVDQLVFVEEWPLEEDRLRVLAGYEARGDLSWEQHVRYETLLSSVERNGPIVERLRAS